MAKVTKLPPRRPHLPPRPRDPRASGVREKFIKRAFGLFLSATLTIGSRPKPSKFLPAFARLPSLTGFRGSVPDVSWLCPSFVPV